MKFTKSSSIGLLALVLPAIGAIVPQLGSRAACGKIADNVIFRRLYSPTAHDHVYTWDGFNEITYWLNGYQLDGDKDGDGDLDEAGRLFTTQEPGTVPFWRLYNNATITHLYTTNVTLRDESLKANPPFVLEDDWIGGPGIVGYVYLDGSCPKTVPLFWAYSASLTDNFYTVNVTAYNSFIANGYQAKGIAAWLYPPT